MYLVFTLSSNFDLLVDSRAFQNKFNQKCKGGKWFKLDKGDIKHLYIQLGVAQ